MDKGFATFFYFGNKKVVFFRMPDSHQNFNVFWGGMRDILIMSQIKKKLRKEKNAQKKFVLVVGK